MTTGSDGGLGTFDLSEHVWTSENGLELTTRELRPVVDEANGRLYAFTSSGAVVLLKEYGQDRARCARDAAITFWGDPSGWGLIDETVVDCECPGCDASVRDWSSAWRMTEHGAGSVKARIMCVSDHGTEMLGDEHTIYTSPHLLTRDGQTDRDIDVDTFSAMIERFGEPYDMTTGEIAPPYRLLYRIS